MPKTTTASEVAFLLDRKSSTRDEILAALRRAIEAIFSLVQSGRLSPEQGKTQSEDVVRRTLRNLSSLSEATMQALSQERISTPREEPQYEASSEFLAILQRVFSTAPSSTLPPDFKAELDTILDTVTEQSEESDTSVLELRKDRAPERVIGYRRVPHPELSEGGVCGLCVLASMNIYKSARLKNLHPGCKCTVVEITPTNDPGGAINESELSELYSMIGGADGKAAHKVRFRKGPDGKLVRYADPKQRKPENDPDEVGRRRRSQRPERSKEDVDRRIAVVEAEIAKYERRAANGEDVALELDSLRSTLRRLKARSA